MTEPRGLREQKKHILRRNVRDTAWALAAQRGYDALTVEDIATGAGISVATFYRHFSSKEACLTRRWLSEERLALLEPLVDRDHGLARAVESLFDSYVSMVAAYQVDLMTRLQVIHLDTGLELAMTRGRNEDTRTLAALFAGITGQHPDRLAMRLAASLTANARITAMARWAELDGQLPLGALLQEVAAAIAPTLDRCETAIETSALAAVPHPAT